MLYNLVIKHNYLYFMSLDKTYTHEDGQSMGAPTSSLLA
jgi:hypothetical protein